MNSKESKNMHSFDEFFEEVTKKNAGLKQEKSHGLAAYRRNYLWGHLEVLQGQYPVTQKALGEKNFLFFAREYLFDSPPSSTSFDLFSQGFATFLAKRSEVKDLALLVPFATLDFLSTQKSGSKAEVPAGSLAAYTILASDNWLPLPDLSPQKETVQVSYEKGRSVLAKV